MMRGSGTHFQWRSASRSHVGTVRKVNEDACLERPEVGLWAVADGMGGHAAGDVASNMIVDALRDLPPTRDHKAFTDDIQNRLHRVNTVLRRHAARQVPGQIVGSTVAVLVGSGTKAICLWAGDSRIYRLRNGRLLQLTRDHSQVEEMIAFGLLRREDAHAHPERNIITRAVGAAPELEIDVAVGDLRVGDSYLLCSDGLNKVVSDAEIESMIQNVECEDVVRALLRLSLMRQARDNVTLVVVQVEETEAAPSPARAS